MTKLYKKLHKAGIKKIKETLDTINEHIDLIFASADFICTDKKINLDPTVIHYYDNKASTFWGSINLTELKFDLYNIQINNVAKCKKRLISINENGKIFKCKEKELKKQLNCKSQNNKIDVIINKLFKILKFKLLECKINPGALVYNKMTTPVLIDIDSEFLQYWFDSQQIDDKNKAFDSYSTLGNIVFNNYRSLSNDDHNRIYNFFSFKKKELRLEVMHRLLKLNPVYEVDITSSVPQAIAHHGKCNNILNAIRQGLVTDNRVLALNIRDMISANRFNVINPYNECLDECDYRGAIKSALNISVFTLCSNKPNLKRYQAESKEIITLILKSKDINADEIDRYFFALETLGIEDLFNFEEELRTYAKCHDNVINLHDAVYCANYDDAITVCNILSNANITHKMTNHMHKGDDKDLNDLLDGLL